MIKQRLKKAKRLHDVQESLQQIEEERIARLRARKDDIARQQSDIVSALSADAGLERLYVGRLKSLSEEATRVDKEMEFRSRTLLAIATRTKFAERLVRNYEQQDAKVDAEKQLLDIIDRIARGDDASLP
ncbi:Flagellar FliJ protein [Hyphomicrobium sp. 1Nfss2.1]|uniref:hypothetical protein n=1 Tax=Hyphomicrobium sp. 1Nfss2.1 TaxID=3413936 RepID=UPI003C7AA993